MRFKLGIDNIAMGKGILLNRDHLPINEHKSRAPAARTLCTAESLNSTQRTFHMGRMQY